MITSTAFVGSQPRQDLTIDEIHQQYKGKDVAESIDRWHADCVRYGALFYNQQRTPYDSSDVAYANSWYSLGDAERARRNMLYFQGDQQNWDMGYLTQIDGGGEMPAPYVAGKDVRKLVINASGSFLKLVRNSKPIVKSYDAKSTSKIKKKIQQAKTLFDEAPFFQEIAEQFGITFKLDYGSDWRNKEEAEKNLLRTVNEDGEIIGTAIVNEILSRNAWVNLSHRTFIEQYVGGKAGIELYRKDGWPYWDVIPSYLLITSAIEDDDFGLRDQIKGWIRSFSPQMLVTKEGLFGNETWGEQIVRKYGEEALDRILKAVPPTDSSITGAVASNMGGYPFNWFNVAQRRIVSYTAVRIYWKGLVDSRELPDKNDPENKIFYLSSKSKKKGKMVQVWRTATLINNTFVVDEGIADEVRDPMDNSTLHCPIQTFQPYTYLGYNRSAVDSIRQYQSDMDAIDYKSREMMGFDMGVILNILGPRLGNAKDPYELLEELKKTRILLETDSGDPDDITNNRPTASSLNFSTVQYAMQYHQLREMKAKMQSDALNVSELGLGTQTSYTSFNVQQASADFQGNNTQYYFWGHMQFLANVMQYSLELMKISVARGDIEKAETVVGDRGVFFIREFKKSLFQTLLLRIDVDDYIGEQSKREMIELMKAYASSGQVDLEDISEIMTMKTWTEVKTYVRWKMQKNKAAAENKDLLDKLTALVNTKMQTDTMKETAMIRQLGQDEANEAATEAKLVGDLIKSDSNLEKQAMQQMAMGGAKEQMPPM